GQGKQGASTASAGGDQSKPVCVRFRAGCAAERGPMVARAVATNSTRNRLRLSETVCGYALDISLPWCIRTSSLFQSMTLSCTRSEFDRLPSPTAVHTRAASTLTSWSHCSRADAGPPVDHQFDFHRLLHRQVNRLHTFKNFADIEALLTIRISEAGSVGY